MAEGKPDWQEGVRIAYFCAFKSLEDAFQKLAQAPAGHETEKGQFLLKAQDSLIINMRNLVTATQEHFSGVQSEPVGPPMPLDQAANTFVGCGTQPIESWTRSSERPVPSALDLLTPPSTKRNVSIGALATSAPSTPLQSTTGEIGRVTLSANPVPFNFQGSSGLLPSPTTAAIPFEKKTRVRISPSPFETGADATNNLMGIGALMSLHIKVEASVKVLHLTFVEPATARGAIHRIKAREIQSVSADATIQLLAAEGNDLIPLPMNRMTRRIKLAGAGMFRVISPEPFYSYARAFVGEGGLESYAQPSSGETVMTFSSAYLANHYVTHLQAKKKHGGLKGVNVEFSFLKDLCGNLLNPQPWYKTV